MVVFGQKWLYSGKKGSIRGKVVVFVKKWLYSGKLVVFGKVVAFGQKWLYLGKSGCNRA